MERKVKYEADHESGFNYVDDGSEAAYHPPKESDKQVDEEEENKILKWIRKVTEGK